MFITSNKTFEFQNPETGERVCVPRGYLGEVPEWAARLWLFRAAVKDAAITYVGQTPGIPAPVDNNMEPSGEAPSAEGKGETEPDAKEAPDAEGTAEKEAKGKPPVKKP